MTDTTSSGFDPEQFKDLQRRQWDEDAAGWHRWKGTLKRWFAVVTSAMLDMVNVKAGDRVLDVGTGTGEPAMRQFEVDGGLEAPCEVRSVSPTA